MNNNLMWFRNDLRIYDNTALHYACKSQEDKVMALFISTPKQWSKHFLSDKKISFIQHHLADLKNKLFALNIILHHHESTDFFQSVQYLIYFCDKFKINNIFYNYQYEINEKNRDNLVKLQLFEKNISVQSFHDSTLFNYKYIKNENKKTYKNFSFFKKKIIKKLNTYIPLCLPAPLKRKHNKKIILKSFSLNKLVHNFDKNIFPIGETQAISRLKNFCKYKAHNYALKRDFPCLNYTSMLSPYLSIGVISVRMCLKTLLKERYNFSSIVYDLSTSLWFNEIIWREFYYHLLVGYPLISKSQSLIHWEKNIQWENNPQYLNAWKQGKTGFPIVDAGMRQLNQIGWMHNRLRMITSSFLVKNLLIDWRAGEKYFISQLIDGDLALNSGGWQWSASIGSDHTPYMRMFNPLLQSKKFDKFGFFIRSFIPELKTVPDNFIHNPHEWSMKKKYVLNYPTPIINYQTTKQKFLSKIHQAQSNNQQLKKNNE